MISALNTFANSMALSNALSDISDPSCGTKIFCVKASLPYYSQVLDEILCPLLMFYYFPTMTHLIVVRMKKLADSLVVCASLKNYCAFKENINLTVQFYK